MSAHRQMRSRSPPLIGKKKFIDGRIDYAAAQRTATTDGWITGEPYEQPFETRELSAPQQKRTDTTLRHFMERG